MISNLVMDTIYQEHNHRLTQWNNTLLNPPFVESYAHAIDSKGSPLPNCFGFIDGTVRPICRPEQNPRIFYNGHKRVHGLKYQSVVLPNGMIANMYNPSELCSSQLWTQFKQFHIEAWKSQDFNGVWTCDLAIPVRRSNDVWKQIMPGLRSFV